MKIGGHTCRKDITGKCRDLSILTNMLLNAVQETHTSRGF